MLEVLRVNVDLACLTSVCGTEQLYTDAAFMLDASTHVAAVSGSGAIIIDLHFMHKLCTSLVDFSPFSAHLMLCARTLTSRASRRSVTLSNYTQTQCSCQTHLHTYKQRPQEAAPSIYTTCTSTQLTFEQLYT